MVAVDGKTLRHSFDRAFRKSPLHLVSAWAADQRLLLGQLAVDGEWNEIIAVPKLLEMLSLKSRIALNLAKLEGFKGSMKGKIKKVGWDNAFLTRLLAGNSNTNHDGTSTRSTGSELPVCGPGACWLMPAGPQLSRPRFVGPMFAQFRAPHAATPL